MLSHKTPLKEPVEQVEPKSTTMGMRIFRQVSMIMSLMSMMNRASPTPFHSMMAEILWKPLKNTA
jgi:hypothetical protein